MYFKRICSLLLCLCLCLSFGTFDRILVHASDSAIEVTEPPDTEPLETVPPETEAQETEPPETESPDATTPETEPPGTEQTENEPLSTEAPEEEVPATEPNGTEPLLTIPAVTEPVEMTTNLIEAEKLLLSMPIQDAGIQDRDLQTVTGQGITFRLFNYSTAINKTAGNAAWRSISRYFTFRNSQMEHGADPAKYDIPDTTINAEHDQDGYKKSHATVERVLNGGYPVLDLTRNADGTTRDNPNLDETVRNLRYLFSSGDHAVTEYIPNNTILQQSGSHYWYNSAEHAVDYDFSSDLFRVRSYSERNSVTATYGASYGDFLPFTYTGGTEIGSTEDGASYHVDTHDTDYWFGMTMQVNFFQTKGGKLGDQNMVFRFSGDDDVWVFIDDVLVLDLGGTHGTVTGSINFATGEVLQYLSWGGANGTVAEKEAGSDTSFPTTIRACFDAAGRTPNGGWNRNGQTFSDFSEHTLKFFYLERGSGVANCSLDFRLPTLPDESLTVTKDLSTDSAAEVRDYIADSLSYCFRVMKVDREGNVTDDPFITAGTSYSLLEDGVKVGTDTVGEDHCFFLKVGQSAQFTQMLRKGNGTTEYVVQEIMPDELAGQYAGVEYLVSGTGGETVTENNPEEPFTAFQTKTLSADQTQTVTFQNRVDTSKLGTLRITKKAAAGTQIPRDLYFQIQVKLGDRLLPAGTSYWVGDEQRGVETEGILLLRASETAEIRSGILAGTSYRVTELSAAFDGYRPTYTGVVQPSGILNCTEEGATGIFPLLSTVHITIVNADYDFAVEIPIQKKILDFQRESTFSFLIEQVVLENGDWKVQRTLPEMSIAVEGPDLTEKLLTIGYRIHDEGVYYYRIREKTGRDDYLYDTGTFLVEVTVDDGTAEITEIYRDGERVDSVLFINRAVTKLTVTKTITGGTGSKKFPFTAAIFLDDKPFLLPESLSNQEISVDGNVLSFSLGHGESIVLPYIPMKAVVRVEEHDCAGFLVFTQLGDSSESENSSAYREIYFDDEAQTVHFKNQSGFRLPNTGGIGTNMFVVCGIAVCLCMSAVSFVQTRKKRGKDIPPEA